MMDSSFTECFQWQKWLFSERDFFILQLIFKKKKKGCFLYTL